VHGILMILLEASYCSFIVPAKSDAAYMHCMHPSTMMFMSLGGIWIYLLGYTVFSKLTAIYSLT
jgi:hypothetical protein